MENTKDPRKPDNNLRQRFWPGRRLTRRGPGQDDIHERLVMRSLMQCRNRYHSFHSEVKL